MRKLLNVGGGSREIPLPAEYAGWQRILLDIDARAEPDVLCDARELQGQAAAQYDAVYCSHNLEHYYAHDVGRVLAGFHHVLREDGFAHIVVPDLGEVMKAAVEKGLDVHDTLYQSPAGPITVHDVIYGWGVEIEQSGKDFYAHKTGFTAKSLSSVLMLAGFSPPYLRTGNLEIQALAFKGNPAAYALELFGLPVRK
jgi:SAM-dependent methyltransferase